MKVTELRDLCNISRPTIYKEISAGLSDFEIIKKYTQPLKQTLKEDPKLTDLKEIKRLAAKMVVEYQESMAKELKFSDVAAIYDIAKKY